MSIIRNAIVSPKRLGEGFDEDGTAHVMRVALNYKDFAAASTTGNFDLVNFPGGLILEDCWAILRQEFSGGAVATATLSVGINGASTQFILAQNVFTGAGAPLPLGVAPAQKGVMYSSPTTVFLVQATPWTVGNIRVACVTSVANTNALTAGKVDLFLKLRASSVRT